VVDHVNGVEHLLLRQNDGDVGLVDTLADHLEGDTGVGECMEDVGGETALVLHASTNAGYNAAVGREVNVSKLLKVSNQGLDGILGGALVEGDSDVGHGSADKIGLHAVCCELLKNSREKAGGVEHTIAHEVQHRHTLLGADSGDALALGATEADELLSRCRGDGGTTSLGLEGVENVDGDLVLDGAVEHTSVKNLVTEVCELGGLLRGDKGKKAGILDASRVTGEDTITLLPHLELSSVKCSCAECSSEVSVATANALDDAALNAAEESSHDGDGVLLEHRLEERSKDTLSSVLVAAAVGVKARWESLGKVNVDSAEAHLAKNCRGKASGKPLTTADDHVVGARRDLTDYSERLAEGAGTVELALDKLLGLLAVLAVVEHGVDDLHVGVLNLLKKREVLALGNSARGSSKKTRGGALLLGLTAQSGDDGDDVLALLFVVVRRDDVADLLHLLSSAKTGTAELLHEETRLIALGRKETLVNRVESTGEAGQSRGGPPESQSGDHCVRK